MKKIPLTQGKFVLVDDDIFEELSKFKWYASKNHNNIFYAVKHIIVNGKQTMLTMHSFIMKTPKGMYKDHIDGDGLNNQKYNLRICNNSENLSNRGKQKNNTSGFKGVDFHKTNKKWRAQIRFNGKYKNLGYFITKEEAYKVYCDACIKYHGEFANIK